MIPDYAKTIYKLDHNVKLEDWRFFNVKQQLLKHDWYGGKVNQFKHYTQRNINLIR